MNTNFYIARHFWKDGKNASWDVNLNFPSALLEDIKSDYTLLENTRPQFKHYNYGTVFFSYKQAKDVYGRRITEITAATSGRCLCHPESLIDLFAKKLQNFDGDNLNFNVDVDDNNISSEEHYQQTATIDTENNIISKPSKTSKNKYIISIVLVVLVGLIVFFVITFYSKPKIKSTKNKVHLQSDVVRNEKSQHSKSVKNQTVKKSKKEVNLHKLTAKKNALTETKMKFKDEYEKLKRDSKEWPLPYLDSHCIGCYIKDQLEDKHVRLAYDEWFENIGEKKFKECRKKSNVSKDDIIKWLVEDGMNKTIVKEFFHGKK